MWFLLFLGVFTTTWLFISNDGFCPYVARYNVTMGFPLGGWIHGLDNVFTNIVDYPFHLFSRYKC